MSRFVAWPPPEELRDLLDRAQHGDTSARDQFLTVLRSPLLAYFSYRLPSDVAEDLTQSALIRLAQAIPRIELSRADRYVSIVARNLVRTAYQRRTLEGRRHVAETFFEVADSRIALDLDVEYRELAQAVREVATTSLPPPLAQIVLCLLDGDTPAEIAVRQRVSPITVRTRLARARAYLRRELRAFLERPECGNSPKPGADKGRSPPAERWRKCRGI